MLFLLLAYFLTQSNLGGDASPIPLVERRAKVSCDDVNQCRTIWSIIWSCLSTVLLCTWVTLHPNIAIAPDTRGMTWLEANGHWLRTFLRNKVLLFLCALIAPEYILAWAIRQYVSAEEIRRKCYARQTNTDEQSPPVREWTRTHGFFLIMGGYHLYSLPDGAISATYPLEFSISSKFVLPLPGHSRDDGKAEHSLDFNDLSAHELAYLAPNETEIKDRGKADIIAKTLVLVQTSWFVAQCIARGLQHLPLTELEVVTLAYAMMNVFIYYFWWDKPKDVECPIRVYTASKAEVVESGEKLEWERRASGMFERVYVYIVGGQDDYSQLREETQVPMFWSGKLGNSITLPSMITASILGGAFGAIHFIAWNSELFPTPIELLLWRISCVAMIAVPLTVTILCSVWEAEPDWDDKLWSFVVVFLVLLTLPVTALLYLSARIATLVMAFTTLRALPLDAFNTTEWATLIPHL